MDSFLNMLNAYGTVVYVVLFGYCALKSGWLPLFAAYGAYLGALDVWIVGLAAFGGGIWEMKCVFLLPGGLVSDGWKKEKN